MSIAEQEYGQNEISAKLKLDRICLIGKEITSLLKRYKDNLGHMEQNKNKSSGICYFSSPLRKSQKQLLAS